MEKGGLPVITLFLRGAVLYIAMILVMRGLGKRQLGEFQPFELAMTILLADVISAPMESVSVPLLNGLLPVAAMFIVHSAISLASAKSERVRAFISGRPIQVIARGEIDQGALRRLCISPADLMEGLRGAGFMDPTKVSTAIVEANGSISAFADSRYRPPDTTELGVQPAYEGLPLLLIVDGHVQPSNLAKSGQDEAWLNQALEGQSLRAEDVYLAVLDTRGQMTLQLKRGGVQAFQAMDAGKVAW